MSWLPRPRSWDWATEVNRFTVVYDACVLYPAPLRDLLMRLALTDLYRARWSDQIYQEWMTAVLRNRPDLSREQLERTRSLMNAHVRDALVNGHQPLIPALELPDPDDRHVLAAAIKCGADPAAGRRFGVAGGWRRLPAHASCGADEPWSRMTP